MHIGVKILRDVAVVLGDQMEKVSEGWRPLRLFCQMLEMDI